MKKRANFPKSLINLALVVFSFSLSLMIGEGICRILLDPVDFLAPEILKDDILGKKIKPNSAGHDSWGFRNNYVPNSAEIVAIGDSQTYGISATAKNSWPSQLQRFIGKEVYNLSLGGYSPVQYYHLLINKAFKLSPSIIIVGLYIGNDFLEAYKSVYTNQYWEFLRNNNFNYERTVDDIEYKNVVETQKNLFDDIRFWLAHNSVLYRVIVYSGVGNLARFLEMKLASLPQNIISIESHKDKIFTGFTPKRRLRALDIDDPKVKEGLQISLELLSKMKELCKKNNIAFVVLLIPIKESVFSEYIEGNRNLEEFSIIDDLLAKERQVMEIVKSYFSKHNIAYLDVLKAMKINVNQVQIYPSNQDGHPNKNGYAIIAESVQKFIKEYTKL